MGERLTTSPASASRTGELIAGRYKQVRDLSVMLTSGLSPEDQTIQSMPDASPTKWHLAHTTWFFETFILAPHAPGYRAFDPAFGYLFNSYYDSIGDRHPRAMRADEQSGDILGTLRLQQLGAQCAIVVVDLDLFHQGGEQTLAILFANILQRRRIDPVGIDPRALQHRFDAAATRIGNDQDRGALLTGATGTTRAMLQRLGIPR